METASDPQEQPVLDFDSLDRATFESIVNLGSQECALSQSWIVCDVHEWCDGSCKPEGMAKLQPLVIGQNDFRLELKNESRDPPLPRAREQQTPLPVEGYQHTLIESRKGQIRLLRVKQADFYEDPVVVEVIVGNLDDPDCPSYAALSYTWGEPIFNHKIICDGKLLEVTASLHGCLKRHRQDRWQMGQHDLLWVDAICIHQRNPEELNQQLSQMPRIYTNASRVLVDIGDVSIDWYPAYDIMFRLRMLHKKFKVDVAEEYKGDFCEKYALPPEDWAGWTACYAPFTSPWFSRTWTIQEFVLAKDRRFRFGRFIFEGTDLALLADFLRYQIRIFPKAQVSTASPGMLSWHFLRRMMIQPQESRAIPMEVLWGARDLRVSHPCDKVVALLGLLTSADKPFAFDYAWSVEELFFKFNEYLLQVLQPWGRADLLSYAGLHKRNVEGYLPSWAPDWSAQGKEPRVFAQLRETRFDASRGVYFPTYSIGTYASKCNMLMQVSVSLGHIVAVGRVQEYRASPAKVDAMRDPDVWREDVLKHYDMNRLAWVQGAMSVMTNTQAQGQLSKYSNVNVAFATTLCAGSLYSDGKATPLTASMGNPTATLAAVLDSMKSGHILSTGEASTNAASFYHTRMMVATAGRRFAVSDQGYMGLVPECSRLGDEAMILCGVSVPMVLRKAVPPIDHAERDMYYTLIGDAYVHDVMDGEAVEHVEVSGGWTPIFIV